MTGRGKYAKETAVPVAQTRQDLEALLLRYGFQHFGVMQQPRLVTLVFAVDGLGYRIALPLPDPEDRSFTHTEQGYLRPVRGDARTPQQLWEQEVAARWRALLLVLRAQLEYMALTGESPARALAQYRVLPDGRTVAEAVLENPVSPPALTWGNS